MYSNPKEMKTIQELTKSLAEKLLKKYPQYNYWSKEDYLDNLTLTQIMLISEMKSMKMDFDEARRYIILQITNPIIEA